MDIKEKTPVARDSGALHELNGSAVATAQAVCASEYKRIFTSDATLKEIIVEALSEIQSDDFALAAAVGMDVLDDWPGLKEA